MKHINDVICGNKESNFSNISYVYDEYGSDIKSKMEARRSRNSSELGLYIIQVLSIMFGLFCIYYMIIIN